MIARWLLKTTQMVQWPIWNLYWIEFYLTIWFKIVLSLLNLRAWHCAIANFISFMCYSWILFMIEGEMWCLNLYVLNFLMYYCYDKQRCCLMHRYNIHLCLLDIFQWPWFSPSEMGYQNRYPVSGISASKEVAL